MCFHSNSIGLFAGAAAEVVWSGTRFEKIFPPSRSMWWMRTLLGGCFCAGKAISAARFFAAATGIASGATTSKL